jgi:hypothetical protein
MNRIDADITIKEKEIQVEQDGEKKAKLQNQLQVLRIRKQIISLQQRIEQLRI